MAGANLPAKKYQKKSPTQLRLSFEFSGNSTQFIDIAAALSAINRRFYRQGLYYYVNSVELYNNEDAFVDLHVLPDNWITKNAWNRGFALWQKMNAMVDSPLSNVGRPRYHDFKVYMSSLHQSTGTTSPKLHGINGAQSTSATINDDWDYSKYVSADDDGDATQQADDFYVHMIGGNVGSSSNWTSVGLIHSYARSRLIITQPEIDVSTSSGPDSHAQDDPLLNVFDFSSEEQMNDIIGNLDTDNDLPPYDVDTYVGQGTSHMQQVARLATTPQVGRVAKSAGFCAPFGLICVDPQQTATAFRVVLNLARGTYHGVYAERA